MKPMSLPALSSRPLVSVLVANYNYGRFLAELVESMLEQSYPNWELIVCDDGSTDDSRTIINRLAATHDRVMPLFKENGGQGSAWNHAFAHSRGEIISLLDADDWYRGDKLSKVVTTFQSDPSVGFVYHRLQPKSQEASRSVAPIPADVPSGWLLEKAIAQGGIAIPASSAASIRRKVAQEIFPIPEELGHYSDGYVCSLAPFLTNIAALPEALAYYRNHNANHSGIGNSGPLDVSTYRRWVEGALVVHRHQKQFLQERFGSSVADRVRLQDNTLTWRYLAALYVLTGKPPEGVYGFGSQEILGNLWNFRERAFWHLFFSVPHPASGLALRFGYQVVWSIRLMIRRLRG